MATKTLKVAEIGVEIGAPVLGFDFELSDGTESGKNVRVGISGTVGDNNLSIRSLTSDFPQGQKIRMMSSFPIPKNLTGGKIPATLKFDFDLGDNNDNLIELEYGNIERFPPKKQKLEASQTILFQAMGDSYFVFMGSGRYGANPPVAMMSGIYISTAATSVWTVKQVGNDYTIFSEHFNLYLASSGNELVMVDSSVAITSNGVSKAALWTFSQEPKGTHTIKNNGNGNYLFASTKDQKTGLVNGTPCSWYLHIK